MLYEYNPVTRHLNTNRSWWVQAETVVGFLNAWQMSGEGAFLDASLNCFEYIDRFVVDHEYGEWFTMLGNSGEVLSEEQAEQEPSPVQLPDSGELMQYLEQQDRSGILRYLRDYMGKLSKEGRMDRSALRLLHQDFLQLVYSYLQRHEIQAHTLYQDPVSQQLQQLADSSSFDMIKWASYVADTALKYVSEVRQTGTVVSHAEAYIREHFREDISRDDVAAAVYVTSSYLSRVFRTETGMKITDFLTRCRIEEAKRLLRTTDQSVSGIAVESGFESFSYFSTVFKKVVGMTPVQYRKE